MAENNLGAIRKTVPSGTAPRAEAQRPRRAAPARTPARFRSFRQMYEANPIERVQLIRDGISATMLVQLSEAMGLPQDRLFEMLDLPRSSMKREIKNNGLLSAAYTERLVGLAKLIGQVEQMVAASGNPKGFNAAEWVNGWLDTPSSALGGRKPGTLMDTAEGRDMVSRLVAQMQSGAYA